MSGSASSAPGAGARRTVPRGAVAGLCLLLRAYKRLVSPLLPAACRFHPTCSEYCEEALRRHGLWRGFRLGARRLCSCHPLGRSGYDPVP